MNNCRWTCVSLCGSIYLPFKDIYEISDSGLLLRKTRYVRIGQSEAFRSIPESITPGEVNKCLYPNTKLCVNGFSKTVMLHRLVALAYIENPNEFKEVNHKDGNRLNNSYVNLEWVTRSENQLHAYRNGLQKKKATHFKLSLTDAEFIRSNPDSLSPKELSNIFDVDITTIYNVINEVTRK